MLTEKRRAYLKQWGKAHPEIHAKASRKWRQDHPGANAAAKRKCFYGITPKEYDKMLKDQKESCKICHRHCSTMRYSLSVDHDHKTNKVRGLLCSKCNMQVAYFETMNWEKIKKYLNL